jgi:hypothetical protein
MSKNILNEIVRIQEIMLGKLSSNLNKTKRHLFEAVGGFDDIIEAIVKSFDNKTDDLFRHSSDEGLESIIAALKSKFPKNKAIRNIDNPKTLRLVYNELYGPDKEFLTKSIIKNSKGTMDNLVVSTIADKIGYTLDDFEQYAKNSTSAQQMMIDLDAPEYFKGIITRYFNKVNDVTDILTKTEINKLSKAVETKGISAFYKDLKSALLSSVDEIASDIEKLNSEYLSKISTNIYSDDEITKLTNAYSVAISRKLNMIEMKLNGGAMKTLDTLNLDATIINKLKNGEGDIFKLFRNLQMQNPGTFWENLKETNRSFIDSIIPKFVTKEILGKKFPLPRFEMSSEFKQFLVTGQWAKFSDLYTEAIKLNALGKSTISIGSKSFKIPNIFKYVLKIIYKSFIGSIIGAFMYAVINTLTIQLKIKKGINKTAKYIGAPEPYPNADKEYIESTTALGGLIPQFLTQVGELLGDVEYVTPIIGTFNKSFLANFVAYIFGSEEAGISVKGIKEVWDKTCDAVFGSDEEDEIKQAIQETPTPNDDTIDIQKDIEPAAPCLFTQGWTVVLDSVNGVPTYATISPDKSQKIYLKVTKENNKTTVKYYTEDRNPCVTN